MKKKEQGEFRIGQEIGYHGREGEIKRKELGGYIVYFSDVGEEQFIDEDELIKQYNKENS